MKIFLSLIACAAVLRVATVSAADLKWSGMRIPCKVSAGDGVKALGAKIGKFTVLSREEAARAISNVNSRFPGSRPWATWAVGDVPDATTLSPEANEECLAYFDKMNVDIFLEIYPRRTNANVLETIDAWLGKLKQHPCVKGFGVDLEYYKRVDDATAQSWDQKIKSHNPHYRMFLKHWEQAFMPPSYRSDIIFICTSSEDTQQVLNDAFASWAAHFAPSACAFQIGYPADEDGMDGKNDKGWWKLPDPIKDWGTALLGKIDSPKQEVGLLWVCAKSGKTYHANWDLTKAEAGTVK